MLRSHVVRGRPRGLFQSSNGWSKMTLLASIVSSTDGENYVGDKHPYKSASVLQFSPSKRLDFMR